MSTPTDRYYVTEVSVPHLGGDGVQRLHSRPLEAERRGDGGEPVTLAQAAGEWAAAHHLPEPETEPESEEYDPGPEVDDEGGMSEYRHYAEWAEVDRAEYEREAGI